LLRLYSARGHAATHAEELWVESGQQNARLYILSRLSSPILRDLTVGAEFGTDALEPEVVSFVRRTSSIRHLRLTSLPGRSLIVEAFPALLELEVLTIGDEEYFSAIPNFDFMKDIPIEACSKLSVLRVQLLDTPESLTPMHDFIESRACTLGVTPIRMVSFDCLHNHSSEEQQERDRSRFCAHVELEQWVCHDKAGTMTPGLVAHAKGSCFK